MLDLTVGCLGNRSRLGKFLMRLDSEVLVVQRRHHLGSPELSRSNTQ